jgi:hypothetical protein
VRLDRERRQTGAGCRTGVLGQCWIHAPGIGGGCALDRKSARCKELSDRLFGHCSASVTATIRSDSEGTHDLSPCGDTLSFCCEPGNLAWLQGRRTWCVGDID